MKITRTFHPVGQGAFYTEEFHFESDKTYRVVFDCGGNENIIENIVENAFYHREDSPQTVIDAVFISHFDDDHVNGLPFLFQYYDVRNLVLPLLSKEDALKYSYDLCHIKGDIIYFKKLLNAMIDESVQSFNDCHVVHVSLASEDDTFDNTDPISISRLGAVTTVKYIKPEKSFDWIFACFNYGNENKQRTNQFLNELKKRNINTFTNLVYPNNVDKFIDEYKSDNNHFRELIKQAYNEVKGTMNGNSMVTYSGSISLSKSLIKHYHLRHIINKVCICCCGFYKPGCIYFGDYEAEGKDKWKKFLSFYNHLWNNVGVVQVPHHGSKHNYNSNINTDPKLNVINAKSKNRYRHPSASVLKEIVRSRGVFVWIKENDSPLIEIIEI